ncbi:C40 family peptidase [Sphingobacterium hotanense]|uniref:C40 family peptidase n=1 Tax=Sphingobacterium hotanense TaxID=649196 RepID=A0ABT7NPQ1_9SPHI|nr:NlpC/P60 family protein [Sphingobacterium hotanense]MDM1049176.1 C40 family peptidase [Sphingobacterium hotanense]
MRFDTKVNFAVLFLLLGALLFSSCGAKKKSTSGPLVGGVRPNKNAPISDASDARGMEYSKDKLENYAALLGVKQKELDNKSLYYVIDEWMGTPHRMGGLDKRGVDCSGFVGMLYRKAYGKDLPRTSRDMADVIKRKYDRQLKEGDLVFFSFGGRNIDHVGIYLHNDKFVHVSTRKGVIISSLKDAWYSKYFTRCGTPTI